MPARLRVTISLPTDLIRPVRDLPNVLAKRAATTGDWEGSTNENESPRASRTFALQSEMRTLPRPVIGPLR